MPPFAAGVALNTIERCGLEIRYLRITSGPQRGRYVHQLVMEAKLGRPLRPDEEVDHANGDTLDNAWNNLELMTKIEHGRKTRRQAVERKRERQRARDTESVAARDEPVPF
jgi:hypothetical protein